MTKEDELKIRKIVNLAIETELKKEINHLNDKFLTKQQVKDLMIKAFIKQNKFTWEKSKFIASYFKEL